MAADQGSLRERLDRRVQVVAGKGGVGRTAISCGLALRSARAGLRTLLLEVNAPDSAAGYLGVEPAVDEPREVLDNLWLCRMTPYGALREYALMILKYRALYNLVFENRMVKYLLSSIPALGEFTMLGKTWFHATETLDDHPRFQRLIVDAPATGHAITFLSVARTVADVTPKGVMKTAAERMAEMVESDEDTCLHVVTLPEEMAVNEGLELIAAAKTRLRMAPGVAIINRLLKPLGNLEERGLIRHLNQQEDLDPGVRPYIEAAALRLDKEDLQSEYRDRFKKECGLPMLEVYDYSPGASMFAEAEPENPGPPGPLPWLDQMVDALHGA